MSEILYRSIAKELNLPADELIATLRDETGGEWLAEDFIAKQIASKLSERVTAASKASRGQGQAEQNSKISAFVKRNGFDNPEDLKGEVLLNAYSAWKEEQSPSAPDGIKLEELDIEVLRKLPQIKQIELLAQQGAGQKFQALQKEYGDYRTEMDTYKRNSDAEKVDEKAFAKTVSYAKSLGIILKIEGSEIDADERLDTIHQRIKLKYKIGLDAKGEPFPQGDDGSALNNNFGDPIKYSDIVLEIGKKIYGVSAQDQSQSGSGIPANSGATPGEKVPPKMFQNRSEYDNFMMTSADPAQRSDAAKSWQYHSQQAAGN